MAVTASGLWRQAHHVLDRRTMGRAALDVGSTFTYLTALFHMPLGNLSAILRCLNSERQVVERQRRFR